MVNFCSNVFSQKISKGIISSFLEIKYSEFEAWYDDLRDNYPNKDSVKIALEISKLKYNFNFEEECDYFGIDIPSFFGNYENANERIMFIAMDPLRNKTTSIENSITIGTPFGLDNEGGRHTGRNKYWELIEPKLKNNFIYLTDIFKLFFRKDGVHSNKIKKFTELHLHKEILKKEIEIVNPTKIITMGGKAWSGFKNIFSEEELLCKDVNYQSTYILNNKVDVIKMPHISGNNLQKLRTVGELYYTIGDYFNDSSKIEIGENIIDKKLI